MLFSTLLITFLGSCTANVLTPFPISATAGAIKFQPVLDFDKDSCYQTAAIGTNGQLNDGINSNGGMGACRDRSRLDNSQTYVRQRCNHGWCAYLYGYYFEVDPSTYSDGHRHDWEHIIVWTLNDQVVFVSWSHHRDWSTEHHTVVRFQDSHPKLVYHQDGGLTHAFRKATPDDDAIENETGQWFKGPLVSLEKMACDVNRKLLNNDWGSAHPALQRDWFPPALNDAMPSDARNNEHFDPWK